MLAIIGGTGIYQLEGLEVMGEHELETPFGSPSAAITQGKMADQDLLFLPRHGRRHELLPSEVNYRANIWALKKLGATQVIGLSAVGSLQEEIAPGDLSLPDQYFDFVKGNREKTFFGNGLAAHVSTAEPTSKCLADGLEKAAESVGQKVHRNKTYACVDGPRLGTRAESFFLRGAAGCDLVGMTNVPEVFLAREAQLCYCTIAIATDYDCWLDDPAQHVSVEQVIARYGASLEKAKQVLTAYITQGNSCADDCSCRKSLASAVLTPREVLNAEQLELLELLSA
ncbi:S-methyl-5'-thioadenosine phosphorylase [Neptuniibacter caesariensis]|uniref:Purine nucleoside phosphorylase n=1 Tax=Neptuniibacter caesariensis TaxID=207954 RepID=A0A7U8GU59_NEPCE|nr:S-methyl-5'-thioadenosine phosphorylase [Neptuniibacter caesariensis]EAR62845.1 Methylthioadenosine phosphorylase [Oceanospirillum sp. MED92] [Neptuniibacter caesariensis]